MVDPHGAASGPDALFGCWLIDIPTAAKPLIPGMFTFTRHGEAVAGMFRASFGEVPLIDLKLDDRRFEFKTSICNGPLATSRGEVLDDRLLIHLGFPGAPSFALPVRRASDGEMAEIEAARPKRLPLPAVVDLAWNGLARTPPMGWNSWNKFNKGISDTVVREIADALVSTGLRDAGYTYVTIDDGWQGRRDQTGILHPNESFPDMKGLGDYLHSLGLKFGIYSSPGPVTCSGFVGSYGHEHQDAHQFADWGVDYLKYDWCSAGEIYHTKFEMRAAYQVMAEALRATGRPIVFSVCQYGLFDAPTSGAHPATSGTTGRR